MTENEARALARERLSDRRFSHTECVAAAAKRLAPRFGADEADAAVAAWLHDLLKEEPDAVLLKTMQGSAIMSDTDLMRARPLWHAFAGGVYARQTLGLSAGIADAVRYHTTGRAGMTPLEKTVFLADYISDDRVFEGVAEVRGIAVQSADAACVAALQNLISHLLRQGRYVHPDSLAAYNDLVKDSEA